MKPLNTTVKDVMREAIQADVVTREFYLTLSRRSTTAEAKKKMQDLADLELVHRVRLERRYKELVGEEPPEPEKPKIEIPDDYVDLDLPRALKIALEHERESESNYRFLAERASGTDLGRLFMELAETEWKHKVKVEAEYYAAARDPEQFLNDI
jgi:rubrerythrin